MSDGKKIDNGNSYSRRGCGGGGGGGDGGVCGTGDVRQGSLPDMKYTKAKPSSCRVTSKHNFLKRKFCEDDLPVVPTTHSIFDQS
jgi:hypothetical protein